MGSAFVRNFAVVEAHYCLDLILQSFQVAMSLHYFHRLYAFSRPKLAVFGDWTGERDLYSRAYSEACLNSWFQRLSHDRHFRTGFATCCL